MWYVLTERTNHKELDTVKMYILFRLLDIKPINGVFYKSDELDIKLSRIKEMVYCKLHSNSFNTWCEIEGDKLVKNFIEYITVPAMLNDYITNLNHNSNRYFYLDLSYKDSFFKNKSILKYTAFYLADNTGSSSVWDAITDREDDNDRLPIAMDKGVIGPLLYEYYVELKLIIEDSVKAILEEEYPMTKVTSELVFDWLDRYLGYGFDPAVSPKPISPTLKDLPEPNEKLLERIDVLINIWDEAIHKNLAPRFEMV